MPLAENGSPLSPEEARACRRSHKRGQRRALLLVTPVVVFLLFAFFAPIASMLMRSAYDPGVADAIPNTLQALATWDGSGIPDSSVQTILADDLRRLALARESGSLGADINRAYPGASSAINSAARRLRRLDDEALTTSGADILLQSNTRWEDPALWRAIAQSGSAYSTRYYLTALDLERTSDGEIQAREAARIYVPLYLKTLKLALIITLLCLVLGYPLAYYLANAKSKHASWLFILVLLPFWTSLLVRTTAWIAILQTNGVMNSTLMTLGLISEPLNVLYTEMATIIAMTHILLPFMILPLYSVMRGIDRSYMRAAMSLGAKPLPAFLRVYLPLTMPGLSAGALLVFIISVGYYITPALVGGTDGQLISNIIAFHMQQSNNWNLAAALGSLLLGLILILYFVYDRLVGASNIKLG
ncbi:MAG: ABC transporter permease [Pseudomonadota bacterium]